MSILLDIRRNGLLCILPIGDSITAYATGAWRAPLRTLLLAQSIGTQWVGSVAEGVVRDGGFHEGHTGHTAAAAAAAFPAYPASYGTTPDCAIVLLGANDATGVAANYEPGINSLLDDPGCLYDNWPTLPVVLCLCMSQWSGPGTPANEAAIATIRAAGNSIVAARAAAGKTIVAARTDLALESYDDTLDGVHPNAAGYVKVAQKICDAVMTLPSSVFR